MKLTILRLHEILETNLIQLTGGYMGIVDRKAETAREYFITSCLSYDTPRLEAEVYPAGVRVLEELNYSRDLHYDIYIGDDKSHDEIFLLIHGGAFVYGSKELDKCFGMHLALESGIPVANIDYTLMPDTDLKGQLQEIMTAVEKLSADHGIRRFHTVGDSAGGYLALIAAILINSEEARNAFGLDLGCDAAADSVNMICGMYKTTDDLFPGVYFETDEKLPDLIYDLSEAVRRYGCPRTVIVTGDKDFLEKDDRTFHEFLTDMGVEVKFYDAVSTDERQMYHVFPISNPAWPEGRKAIEMITDNAAGR